MSLSSIEASAIEPTFLIFRFESSCAESYFYAYFYYLTGSGLSAVDNM